MKKFRVTIIRNQDFVFSIFELVTRNLKNKSSTIELVTLSET